MLDTGEGMGAEKCFTLVVIWIGGATKDLSLGKNFHGEVSDVSIRLRRSRSS